MMMNSNNNKILVDGFYRYSMVFILAFVLILGSGVVLWYTHEQTKEISKKAAIVDAKHFASSVSQFRNFYSKTIVPIARDHGMKINHNYLNEDSSLPLPATFAKDFAKSLSVNNSAYSVKLYSDLPFPWRKNEVLDEFEKSSLEQIKKSPNKEIWKFETIKGVPVLRYARGDILKESCVNCHNNYSGTPKKDWKTGDVRGILEVIRPISAFESQSASLLKNSFLMMLAIILSMVMLLFFMLRKLTGSIKSTYSAFLKEEKLSKELKASDVKMHAIVDSVQECIVVLKEDGTIEESNYAIQPMFGYDQKDIVGKNISLLLDDNEINDPKHPIDDIVGYRKEIIGIKNTGDKFPVELFVNKANFDNETIYTASLRDISYYKEAEEVTAKAHKAAIESAELKSEFLANMSHEIRTPMNGVIGMTDLLLSSKLNNDQEDWVSTVRESADSLLTIINDILDFSKIEAGKLSLNKTTFDLLKMIEATINLLSKEADYKDVEMTFFIDSDVPLTISQDSGRLRQVLINLFSNAIKFTKNGNIILHISMLEKDTLNFSIIDTGIGIPEDSQDSLFESFSQVDGSNSREYGGTGLGLAISKQLIHLMGGDIGVKSELHVGSIFWFTLKIEPILEEVKPYIYGNNSVLMLSSSDLLNRYYKNQLEQWGMKPTIVKNLNDLTDVLDNNNFEMLCIDTDHIYLDSEIPESFLQVIKTIRMKSNGLLVLYANRQQYTKIIKLKSELKLGKEIFLFEKPVKHSAIKALLSKLNQQKHSVNDKLLESPKELISTKNDLIQKEKPTETQKESEEINSFHILLAEDNLINQKVAAVMLKKLGYQVTIVENGKEAFEKAKSDYFDAILMDCQMPVMDGYEATRCIRELPSTHHNIDIPIIAFTAHAMKDDDNVCKEAGMDDYLSKPVTLDSLNSMFEKWIETIHKRKEKHLKS